MSDFRIYSGFIPEAKLLNNIVQTTACVGGCGECPSWNAGNCLPTEEYDDFNAPPVEVCQ